MPKAPRGLRPPPGIPAKYDSLCYRCDQPIYRGDRIAYRRGLPIHCACASGGDDA